MDGLLLEHGVRDIALVVEPPANGDRQTQSLVNGHLAATFSDMTQRSRAIRLLLPGADAARVVASSDSPEARSISSTGRYLLRASFVPNAGTNAQGQILGLELALLNSRDLSVVPGTGRHNEISLRAGPAAFSKFGMPFSVAAATTAASATRALVEMSAIEMVGRLTRLPYWTCFGVDDSNDAVNLEIQDWYDALAASPAELIGYFQQALRQRRLYSGPVDGTPNAEFRDAVARTRESLGQPREAKLSLDFFKAWLGTDAVALASALATVAPPPAVADASPGPSPSIVPPAIAPLATPMAALPVPPSLRVSAGNEAGRFARGASINLSIRPSRDAHVYCFLQDEQRRIVRFFPNRFQPDSRVATGAGLQLPGAAPFQLVMNNRGITETVSCFATERDVLGDLPSELNRADLAPLPVASLDQVKAAFIHVSGGVLGHGSVELRTDGAARR